MGIGVLVGELCLNYMRIAATIRTSNQHGWFSVMMQGLLNMMDKMRPLKTARYHAARISAAHQDVYEDYEFGVRRARLATWVSWDRRVPPGPAHLF